MMLPNVAPHNIPEFCIDCMQAAGGGWRTKHSGSTELYNGVFNDSESDTGKSLNRVCSCPLNTIVKT